jgi:hypothetical protein
MGTPIVEQGQAPSIESRIENALFGQPTKVKPKAPEAEVSAEPEAPEIEETEQPEGEEAPAVEEIFEFEQDGVKYALPKALEKAVLQERDYTQKTQTLAEQRKQFELLHEQARIANFRQEFESEVATELQQLQAYDAVLKQPIDWSQMTTDEAFRKKLQLDQWKDEREAIAKTLHGKHQQYEKKTQDALKELKTKALDTISKRIPNWNEAEAKALREHALSDGYTAAELDSILDPRHTLTLWKAKQFDQLRAKASKTVTDVKTVKTTPSNPMTPQTKNYLNYRKTLQKTAPNSPQRRRAVEERIADKFSR